MPSFVFFVSFHLTKWSFCKYMRQKVLAHFHFVASFAILLSISMKWNESTCKTSTLFVSFYSTLLLSLSMSYKREWVHKRRRKQMRHILHDSIVICFDVCHVLAVSNKTIAILALFCVRITTTNVDEISFFFYFVSIWVWQFMIICPPRI